MADADLPPSPEDAAAANATPDEPASAARSTTSRVVTWGALGFLAIGAGLCGSMVLTLGARLIGGDERPEEPPPPAVVTEVAETHDVVVAIADLARLETVQFHMERVVDLKDRQRQLFGLVDAEDAILLVAAGDVRAGVDLAELDDDAVEVAPSGEAVTVTLPAPVVLSARLDAERTYVHTRQTDVLARRSDDLETRARQEAERTIQAAAVEAGVLDRARENARRTVAALVRSFDFDRVDVRFEDEPPPEGPVVAPE